VKAEPVGAAIVLGARRMGTKCKATLVHDEVPGGGPVGPREAPRVQGARGKLFASHAQRRYAKAVKEADAFVGEVPQQVLDVMVGGEAATRQVPSAAERRALVKDALLAKGGPEGATTRKGLRAWRLLAAAARERHMPAFGLPASVAFVASIVKAEQTRASAAGTGSQGGATVGGSILDGFALLADCGVPVPSDGVLLEAAAKPQGPRKARPRGHAGSLPIGVQCQLEYVAAATEASALRTLARAILVSSFVHNVRLNDALNAKLFADERSPRIIIRGRTAVASKDGIPLELYAPAEGWLGPFEWYEEHLEQFDGLEYSVPEYCSKPAGRPSMPGTVLLDGVCSPDHARQALRDICRQPPLCMSDAEFDAIHLTTHSVHGTGPDMVRTMIHVGGYEYCEADARAMGHWLRDKNAPQEDPRKVPGAPRRGQADGAPVVRGAMNFRYTSGVGRRGERQEQLAVRGRFVADMRRTLERADGGWWRLPKTVDSWDVFQTSGAET